MRSRRCRDAARRARAVLLIVPLFGGACKGITGGDDTTICTTVVVFGLVGTARDAATGADITPGAYLVAREGSFSDSVTTSGTLLLAAPERAGTYEVTIGRDGYLPSSLNGVVVDRNRCHVVPVFLVGSLTPKP